MIPKKIHYCWFGGGPIPEKDQKCIESWKKCCPDYEIIQWNESNYDVTKNRYMHQAYQAKKWGFVPDYARLDIIYENGGVYLDTDVELLKNLDPILDQAGFAGFERPDQVNMGVGFGAEKGSDLIKKMRDQYDNMEFINQDGTMNLLPSPSYSTEIFKQKGFSMDGTLQSRDGFCIYPKEYFCPRDYHSGETHITENTYSIHWFNASWQTPHQKRMRKVRRMLGDKLYFKLVDGKNLLLGKKKK